MINVKEKPKELEILKIWDLLCRLW